MKRNRCKIEAEHPQYWAFATVFLIALTVFVWFLNSGCKPSDIVPPAPPDSVRYRNFVLEWNAPDTNIDGTPLTDLAGYSIWHRTSTQALHSKYGDTTATIYFVRLDGSFDNFLSVDAFDTAGNHSQKTEIKVDKWFELAHDSIFVSDSNRYVLDDVWIESKTDDLRFYRGGCWRVDAKKVGTIRIPNIFAKSVQVHVIDDADCVELLSVSWMPQVIIEQRLLSANDDQPKVYSFFNAQHEGDLFIQIDTPCTAGRILLIVLEI